MYGKDLLPLIQASNRTDKFSLNLMEWVKRHTNVPLFVAYSQISYIDGSQLPPFSFDTTCPGSLYIGLGDLDKGWLHGSRLSEIIGQGTKTKEWANPPEMDFHIVPEWLTRYINLGKCCIDPEHTLYGDKERWNVSPDGKTRSCLWCNEHTQHEHIELVEEKSWHDLPQIII